ncbi:MAG: polyprenyl synthetase family protein [Alistipes sp.]|nr:polyprenyl synthetase family protein [Candidatus Alistipes equi]
MNISLEEIREPIKANLTEFEDFVRKSLQLDDETLLSQMVDYVLSTRGKGIRPVIVMLCAASSSTINSFGKRTYLAALLVEIIHQASLVHDDVIDNSDKRRGRPSVNALWQSHNAVLVGDYLLSKLMTIGLQSGQFDLLSHIVGTLTTLCEGEVLQNDHASRLDTTRQDYYSIIEKKTASLFATSATAGALSVKASHDIQNTMYMFGYNLGMAFQIVDDILDYETNVNTGKPSMEDVLEKKITLPLIEIMERSSEQECERLREIISRCPTESNAVEQIREIVLHQKGIDYARETMKVFIQKALSSLSQLPKSIYVDSLMKLCQFVAERNN